MGTHESGVQIPAVLLTLGKSLSFSDPQFPHFTRGRRKGTKDITR